MEAKTPINHSIVIESEPTAFVEVRNRILSELEAHNFSNEDVFAVHLALEEAFLNAHKHGNKMDAGKEIKIDYSVRSDKIEISIIDEGDGFNPEGVPDPRAGENLYRAEGRGLFLMRSYMDVVKYNERGNRVHMVRYREKPPLTETPGQIRA